MRLVKVKGTKKSLNVPQWVRDEWATGSKDELADLFARENFNKDSLINVWFILSHCFKSQMASNVPKPASIFFHLQDAFINNFQIMVTKRQSFKLTVDEGWYSESEMRDELSWNASFTQPFLE